MSPSSYNSRETGAIGFATRSRSIASPSVGGNGCLRTDTELRADMLEACSSVSVPVPLGNLLPPKTAVLGIWTDRAARAYIISTFGRTPREVTDRLDGRSIKLQFTPQANHLRVIESDEGVSWMYSFWFAWYAFRPQTDIFKTP